MHGAIVASLNPEILIWARETAGLDRETAARKIDLKAARGIAGADRLAAMEVGEVTPTAPLLRRMAAQYHRPLLTFYMPKVPAPAELGQDFRTLPDQGDRSNVLLATLLRDVKARQALVREILEDDDDVAEVVMVNSARDTRDSAALATMLVHAIGFNRDVYRRGSQAYG